MWSASSPSGRDTGVVAVDATVRYRGLVRAEARREARRQARPVTEGHQPARAVGLPLVQAPGVQAGRLPLLAPTRRQRRDRRHLTSRSLNPPPSPLRRRTCWYLSSIGLCASSWCCGDWSRCRCGQCRCLEDWYVIRRSGLVQSPAAGGSSGIVYQPIAAGATRGREGGGGGEAAHSPSIARMVSPSLSRRTSMAHPLPSPAAAALVS